MSTPQERVSAEIKDAMKARDAERVSTLRMLLTAIKNEAIQLGGEVDEKAFLQLVKRGVKQRREAADQYRKGDRTELAEKEERELVILEGYLPQQVGEDEIRAAVTAFVAAEGIEGMKGMGVVMKAMLAKFGDSADGGTVSRIAREVLS